MGAGTLVIFLLGICLWQTEAVSYKQGRIASIAEGYIGFTRWSYASSHSTGPNTNKCNIFVADVVNEAGGSVPRRWWGLSGPIGAGEWGNPSSSYLTSASCWSRVSYPGQRGDIISDGVHVGIVTGGRTTTSASSRTQRITKNSWGYQSGDASRMTVWRYTC